MTKQNKSNQKQPQKHADVASALREARDSSKISLKTAAKDTRINITKLERFESGRFDMGNAYTAGQLASYAKYLGVDHKMLFELDKSDTRRNISSASRYKRVRSFVASNSLATSVLVGVVALALGSAVWLSILYFAAPKLIVNNPAKDGTVTGHSIMVEGETSSGSEVFINGEPILVDLEGGFEHRVLLQEGLNEIQIKAVNSLSREAVKNRILIVDFPDN